MDGFHTKNSNNWKAINFIQLEENGKKEQMKRRKKIQI